MKVGKVGTQVWLAVATEGETTLEITDGKQKWVVYVNHVRKSIQPGVQDEHSAEEQGEIKGLHQCRKSGMSHRFITTQKCKRQWTQLLLQGALAEIDALQFYRPGTV